MRFQGVYQDVVMFPAAPHSAAHGDRCHHGKEGDKSCGETLGERIQAPRRLLPVQGEVLKSICFTQRRLRDL
ncbi:hypothetical protein DV515_00012538 [Chloebia gouldiae]|uniref:Uncharacterized protein n=1 Tax=Chloebia gouldiae TaxID=44316 RepID=A0A3L8S3P3_CHLGU|nr:hypothetical protein DV515_00012538 [Chloebia gouldiae]